MRKCCQIKRPVLVFWSCESSNKTNKNTIFLAHRHILGHKYNNEGFSSKLSVVLFGQQSETQASESRQFFRKIQENNSIITFINS